MRRTIKSIACILTAFFLTGAFAGPKGAEKQRPFHGTRPKDQGVSEICFEDQSNPRLSASGCRAWFSLGSRSRHSIPYLRRLRSQFRPNAGAPEQSGGRRQESSPPRSETTRTGM